MARVVVRGNLRSNDPAALREAVCFGAVFDPHYRRRTVTLGILPKGQFG